MLSERISTLYALLQCNNTDIAHFSGCSSANISRLKSGYRVPNPKSKTIALFAEGVYAYADYENILDSLAKLCASKDTSRESLIPALVSWLYEADESFTSITAAEPKSKRTKAMQRKKFGERLDRAATLLELSNSQLSTLLNIDSSLVSRYRSGIYSPHGNDQVQEKLSLILVDRAVHMGKADELASLCGTDSLDSESISHWLYELTDEDTTVFAQMLLRSLDSFSPIQGLSSMEKEPPTVEISDRYWETEGLRSAVIRFLSDAANEGGELVLYSDEPMDWMTDDPDFFMLWASLMIHCVKRGVHIRIIHNLNRGAKEMVSAISGWFPLYISGMVEPYVLTRDMNPRFCHTCFLRLKSSCILGFYPSGAGRYRWYDFITDQKCLDALEAESETMLSSAIPFLKTYTELMSEEFRSFCMEQTGPRDYLLSVPPVFTMPGELLSEILTRKKLSEKRRFEVLAIYGILRDSFLETLKKEQVNLLLYPPSDDDVHHANFYLDLMDINIDYTAEEYSRHLKALSLLVEKEKNFHLTLLPQSPFSGIQLLAMKGSVAVTRSQKPLAAFVFMNESLGRSVSDYMRALIEQNSTDRAATIARLRDNSISI